MNILKELTKDFQYENSITNPEVRKLTSGPFRGVWVNRNGFCYSERNGKTLKISQGYYKSCGGHKAAIRPWRLCALVWYDQTPSLHLDDGDRDKYLNLLSFIKLLERYPDEYELVIDETKTNYYPVSQLLSINVLTGCLVKNANIKLRFPTTYSEIKWDYFNEICEKTITDFHSFKDELSEELKKNLKGDLPKVNEDKEEDEEDPEEELEVCLSDPELGGAPSLRPKVEEDHSQSDICHSDNNIPEETRKMEENYSEKEEKINKLIKKLIKASEKRDCAGTFHLDCELRRMGLTHEEIDGRMKVLMGISEVKNKVDDCSDIPGYDPNLPMEAQESSVLDEIELRGYRDYTPSPNITQILKEKKTKAELEAKPETKEDKTSVTSSSSSDSIEELQKLFDRRAQLKKELTEIEEKIKEKLQ